MKYKTLALIFITTLLMATQANAFCLSGEVVLIYYKIKRLSVYVVHQDSIVHFDSLNAESRASWKVKQDFVNDSGEDHYSFSFPNLMEGMYRFYIYEDSWYVYEEKCYKVIDHISLTQDVTLGKVYIFNKPGELKGGIYDRFYVGKYESVSDDGTIVVTGRHKKSVMKAYRGRFRMEGFVKCGTWKVYVNGVLQERKHYQDGELNGKYFFYRDGISVYGAYKDWRPVREWRCTVGDKTIIIFGDKITIGERSAEYEVWKNE